jgi:hypothetical protein
VVRVSTHLERLRWQREMWAMVAVSLLCTEPYHEVDGKAARAAARKAERLDRAYELLVDVGIARRAVGAL